MLSTTTSDLVQYTEGHVNGQSISPISMHSGGMKIN